MRRVVTMFPWTVQGRTSPSAARATASRMGTSASAGRTATLTATRNRSPVVASVAATSSKPSSEPAECSSGESAAPSAGAGTWGVGVVLVAPELGPVALEDGVVAPDGLPGPAGEVDVAYQVGVPGRSWSWSWSRVAGSRLVKAVSMALIGAGGGVGVGRGWARTAWNMWATASRWGWGARVSLSARWAVARSGRSVIWSVSDRAGR